MPRNGEKNKNIAVVIVFTTMSFTVLAGQMNEN